MLGDCVSPYKARKKQPQRTRIAETRPLIDAAQRKDGHSDYIKGAAGGGFIDAAVFGDGGDRDGLGGVAEGGDEVLFLGGEAGEEVAEDELEGIIALRATAQVGEGVGDGGLAHAARAINKRAPAGGIRMEVREELGEFGVATEEALDGGQIRAGIRQRNADRGMRTGEWEAGFGFLCPHSFVESVLSQRMIWSKSGSAWKRW